VVNHWGSLDGGHYTSQIKSKRDGKWYNVDDTSVELMDEQEQFTTGEIESQNPYLLFYTLKGQ